MSQPIDQYARSISDAKQAAVADGSAAGTDKRAQVLGHDYPDPGPLRQLAGAIKDHTLHHLGEYLVQAEAALQARGVHVHFAATAGDARETILGILRGHGVERLTKSKSMASEEVHLNGYLAENGIECLESDLGEFIVQLDGDTPSHIVKPIIHKNRREIARTFLAHGIGSGYSDDPQEITRRARAFLRAKFFNAQAAITGGNFLCADTGRLVLVTNEGNARFGMAPTDLHIALVGIEKLIPRERDLGVFLNLLGRSATGQQLTVYTQFINGPRSAQQPSGPRHMHVVLLDNGRSDVLAGDCRKILRCIRCGACQNVCPVYRQASGHAYRSTYGGPVGAVLSPLLAGPRFAGLADLPKASTLCGACQDVCPVDIPIPELLLRLRNAANQQKLPSPDSPPMAPFATLASSPRLWRSALRLANTLNHLPAEHAPLRPLQQWLGQRNLPEWRAGKFRAWLAARQAEGGTNNPT